MNIADLPEDSDTSDEDYVPGEKPEEVVSEVESDGDPEDPLSDTEDLGKRTKKRKKKGVKSRKKQKVDLNISGAYLFNSHLILLILLDKIIKFQCIIIFILNSIVI